MKNRYFGFLSQKDEACGLGVFKKHDKILCYGEFEVFVSFAFRMLFLPFFKNGRMKGLGRVFMDSMIFDGVFEDGILNGKIGVHYSLFGNNHILGEFERNNCKKVISSGIGFPKKLLSWTFIIFLLNLMGIE